MGYTLSLNKVKDKTLQHKKFMLGKTEVEIVNDMYKRFFISELLFKMDIDGNFFIDTHGMINVKSLDELKSKILRYKKMYLKFQELGKQVKMIEDFV